MKQEMFLQMQCARWLNVKGILYNTTTQGMKISRLTAVNFKRCGYKAGFPDMFIYEPRGRWHGLAIELKVGNYPTEHQKNWVGALSAKGYKTLIMPTGMEFNEAFNWFRDEVEKYMKGED